MDKDYHKEREFIKTYSGKFVEYLYDNVLSERAAKFFKEVARQTNVYIFSGIIRNFLLGFSENRDVDIVVEDLSSVSIPDYYIRDAQMTRNEFGGLKLRIDNLTIDIWSLETTWGLLHAGMKNTQYSLIKTAFFNFSSIAFDYNQRRFIYDDVFLGFIKTHIMDVVFKDNPNKALCVLNTCYYAKKYGFPIAYGLCKWLIKNYKADMPLASVEQRHFHSQSTLVSQIPWMMNQIEDAIRKRKMRIGQALKLDFVQRSSEIISESSY